MNIGIIGSGFGLYGYLPAICETGHTPVILDDKTSVFSNRPELAKYGDRIIRVGDLENLSRCVQSVILAIPPSSQTNLFLELSKFKNIHHYFLEKPIGTNSDEGRQLIDLLELSKISFSVAYLFKWTDWFEKLNSLMSGGEETDFYGLEISWAIKKADANWKTNSSLGGGILNFYLPHVLAMYWELGYSENDLIISGTSENITISGIRSGSMKLSCSTFYSDEFRFSISQTGNFNQIIFESDTPFGPQNRHGAPDTRIVLLKKYIARALERPASEISLERFINGIRSKHERLLNF